MSNGINEDYEGIDPFNPVVDHAIKELVDGNYQHAADALQELAYTFAKAGLPMSTFLNVRQYAINEAKERTSATFIEERLKLIEQQNRVTRNGTIIIQ